MNDNQSFAPFYKVSNVAASQTGSFIASVTVAATAGGATASSQLPGTPNGGGSQLFIANTSTTAFAYVNVGVNGSVTAATVAASFPIPPLATKTISVHPEVNGASVIMGAGAASVIFTRGNGVG
jgi:uncharacterized membrane protein